MYFEANDSKAAETLGWQTMSQAARELQESPFSIFLVHKHLRLILSRSSIMLAGNLRVQRAKMIREAVTELSSDNFPP